MSLDKLKRVMWRLRSRNPETHRVPKRELERAIMVEIGTSTEAITNNRASLVKLGWIEKDKHYIWLTDNDLTGDY